MDTIQHQIQQSIESESGYFPNPMEIYKVQTDINVFPYNRFFRGEPNSFEPIVWDREAGFQEILPQTFEKSELFFEKEPEKTTCFQNPCSTVLPCNTSTKNFQKTEISCVYTSP